MCIGVQPRSFARWICDASVDDSNIDISSTVSQRSSIAVEDADDGDGDDDDDEEQALSAISFVSQVSPSLS